MRYLVKDDQRKQSADKGSDRVIRAGSRRAESPLRVNVEKYAKLISHQANTKNRKETPENSYSLAYAKSYYHRAKPREYSLEQYYLQGIFRRYLTRAVVFEAPADAGKQNK